ncbi:hypothetical protein [Asaia astilbis]|uniref:hypothetical protein n=1 Tax=Asaia astilbis TaxID=610244 RepID=UPI000471637B|nr:hypothetical protein [Asaia astilbis]
MTGAGSALAEVSDKLQIVQGAATAGTNLSALPSAVSSVIDRLETAGSGLMTLIDKTGQNLEGITLNNFSSLAALSLNAQLTRTSVDAGAAVNRVSLNAATATNVDTALTSLRTPVVRFWRTSPPDGSKWLPV